MKIYLDDQLDDPDLKDRRSMPEGWIGAKNFSEFKQIVEDAVTRGEKIEAFDFDNDLGEEMEGIHIIHWLGEQYPELIIGAECRSHSANSERKKDIENYAASIKKNPREAIEAKNRPHPWGEMKRR